MFMFLSLKFGIIRSTEINSSRCSIPLLEAVPIDPFERKNCGFSFIIVNNDDGNIILIYPLFKAMLLELSYI